MDCAHGIPLKYACGQCGNVPVATVADTLNERGARYGDFSFHADIAQHLIDEMRGAPNWPKLSPDKRQALTVIADKIARILNGDPEYRDNWHDIQGYAKLAEDRCTHDRPHPPPPPPQSRIPALQGGSPQHPPAHPRNHHGDAAAFEAAGLN